MRLSLQPLNKYRTYSAALLAFSIGLVILLPLAYFPWKHITREMKHEVLCTLGLDNGEWAYYDFSEEEFQSLRFVENGREFWYNQKMHDVLSIERSAGRIQVIALPDEEETSFMQLLSKNNERHDKTQMLFFAFCGWVDDISPMTFASGNRPFVVFTKVNASFLLPSGRNGVTDGPPPEYRIFV